MMLLARSLARARNEREMRANKKIGLTRARRKKGAESIIYIYVHASRPWVTYSIVCRRATATRMCIAQMAQTARTLDCFAVCSAARGD